MEVNCYQAVQVIGRHLQYCKNFWLKSQRSITLRLVYQIAIKVFNSKQAVWQNFLAVGSQANLATFNLFHGFINIQWIIKGRSDWGHAWNLNLSFPTRCQLTYSSMHFLFLYLWLFTMFSSKLFLGPELSIFCSSIPGIQGQYHILSRWVPPIGDRSWEM